MASAWRTDPNRNWRVFLSPPLPSRWSAGAPPRMVTITLVTDFGDKVSEAGNEGPWDSEGPKSWQKF
jgi:hypothetical protein